MVTQSEEEEKVKFARFINLVCNQTYRRMITDLYFISGLFPELAKSS